MSSTQTRAIVYAGSLRPGGGLTVVKLVLEALVSAGIDKVIVYTGAADCSEGLQETISSYDQIEEKRFFGSVGSQARYFLSKIHFPLASAIWGRNTFVFTFNFYLPVFVKQIVFQINLSLFLNEGPDPLAMKIRKFDGALACRFADINLFESEFIRERAHDMIGSSIRGPEVLYIGVDPEFYRPPAPMVDGQILVVSSNQPHKDNDTCLRTLALLVERHANVNWNMVFVGGQRVSQWDELLGKAKAMGLGDHVDMRGPQNKKDLSALMAESLCLLSASRVESFCMVAVEAMASHCPAVVTNVSTMPESVGPAGLLVDPGSESQFAETILALHDNPEDRAAVVQAGLDWSHNFKPEQFQSGLRQLLEKHALI